MDKILVVNLNLNIYKYIAISYIHATSCRLGFGIYIHIYKHIYIKPSLNNVIHSIGYHMIILYNIYTIRHCIDI